MYTLQWFLECQSVLMIDRHITVIYEDGKSLRLDEMLESSDKNWNKSFSEGLIVQDKVKWGRGATLSCFNKISTILLNFLGLFTISKWIKQYFPRKRFKKIYFSYQINLTIGEKILSHLIWHKKLIF